jgi:hypothetical protein
MWNFFGFSIYLQWQLHSLFFLLWSSFSVQESVRGRVFFLEAGKNCRFHSKAQIPSLNSIDTHFFIFHIFANICLRRLRKVSFLEKRQTSLAICKTKGPFLKAKIFVVPKVFTVIFVRQEQMWEAVSKNVLVLLEINIFREKFLLNWKKIRW